MKKSNSRVAQEDLVQEVQQELERIVPDNSEIEFSINESPVGHFKTMIKLHVGHKVFVANKEDDVLYKSFSRALNAMKSQLQKFKNKNDRMHFRVAPVRIEE